MPIKKYSIAAPSFRADREEWLELLGESPSDKTLSEVGLSRPLWSAILAGSRPWVPAACSKLAHFRRFGSLADLLGSDWSDFFALGDALICPGVKYPIPARDLAALWVSLMEFARVKSEAAMLWATAKEKAPTRGASVGMRMD